jgi:hypothetical protein
LHFVIPDPHDAQASRLQNTVAFLIVVLLAIVHISIHFHNQTCRVAVKVGNEPVNQLLPSKVQASPIAPQPLPKDRL